MRRHAGSEKRRKILRRVREGGDEEGAGAAEIGSRVFPFRTPPTAPASMPTVGTRRSTRVFVPKQQQRAPAPAADGDAAGVLRSGKRFTVSTAKEDDGREWLKVLGAVDADGHDPKRWWKEEEKKNQEVDKGDEGKKLFGAVYSRKRRRSAAVDVKDRKFGIVFERKRRKKDEKAKPPVGTVLAEAPIVDDPLNRAEFRVRKLRFVENSKAVAAKLGILDSELWSGFECGPLVLVVVVDSSVDCSLDHFKRFVFSMMSRMRRARIELWRLVAFLFGRSIATVFSCCGIHLLPIRHQKNRVLDGNFLSSRGFCKIYEAVGNVPLLAVSYSTLPSFFKCLHEVRFLGSLYLPRILHSVHLLPVLENSLVAVPCEDSVPGSDPPEMGIVVAETPAVKGDEFPMLEDSYRPVSPKSVIINGPRLRKHQRKRSSLKNSRVRNLSLISKRFVSFRSGQNGSSAASLRKSEFAVAPVSVKPPDSCLPDSNSGREESDASSSPGSCSKLRKLGGLKSSVEKVKERLAVAEVRQNIDSACCKANILVSDTEKCWREGGAQVMMEMAGSQEWFIAVKRGQETRLMHKPQDLRPCVVNRFTHAYMWSGDDFWKLEFCDKWDWIVFKELHSECRDRNALEAPAKVIPVPGIKEVSGYEDDVIPAFTRPDMYIRVISDEVGRALASETSYYDMDSADEEWLRQLNSSLTDAKDGSCVSEENFERIIFGLEKDAYSCADDVPDKERALSLCQELGTKDTLSAIYDYWLKKRKLKRGPLARVFQGQPLRKTQLVQKPILRKRRSFKRQRSQAERNHTEWSQAGRGKPDLFLQAHLESIQKVQEAEAAATRATDIAIQLRSRAQMLMSNADLAAYKAAMALRIAETLQASSSSSSADIPVADSLILFD